MTIGKQIKDQLAAAGGKRTFRQLHEEIGGDDAKITKALYNLKYNGKVKVADDDDRTVSLLTRKAAPPQGRRAKPAGKKAVKRPYKRLAAKVARRNGVDIPALALDNYIGAGALLRQAIEDGVDDLSTAHGLRNALANHDRAEKILAAAKR
jgi:hypothetical protein